MHQYVVRLRGRLCCHGDLCSLASSKRASSWRLSLGFIRDRNWCRGVATYSDSQNEYRKVVHHVANASEPEPRLLSTQEVGLSDY